MALESLWSTKRYGTWANLNSLLKTVLNSFTSNLTSQEIKTRETISLKTVDFENYELYDDLINDLYIVG